MRWGLVDESGDSSIVVGGASMPAKKAPDPGIFRDCPAEVPSSTGLKRQ
jgi:hypothetical protein